MPAEASDATTNASGRGTRDRAFDEALGTRLRLVRVSAGMSQTTLAKAVGVSFQQVQKYEKGKDRVAVATMVAMARALGVRPEVFLDDEPVAAPTGLSEMRETLSMARRLREVGDDRVRRSLGALVDVLSEGRGEGATGTDAEAG